MNVLIHGGESLKRVESLLKLVTFKASPKSDDMKEAIKSYFDLFFIILPIIFY